MMWEDMNATSNRSASVAFAGTTDQDQVNHRGDAGEREHHHAPPPGRLAGEVEYDAHKAVDRDLGHDAAQEPGDRPGNVPAARRVQAYVTRAPARVRASPPNSGF